MQEINSNYQMAGRRKEERKARPSFSPAKRFCAPRSEPGFALKRKSYLNIYLYFRCKMNCVGESWCADEIPDCARGPTFFSEQKDKQYFFDYSARTA
jgi:hypothetical protein